MGPNVGQRRVAHPAGTRSERKKCGLHKAESRWIKWLRYYATVTRHFYNRRTVMGPRQTASDTVGDMLQPRRQTGGNRNTFAGIEIYRLAASPDQVRSRDSMFKLRHGRSHGDDQNRGTTELAHASSDKERLVGPKQSTMARSERVNLQGHGNNNQLIVADNYSGVHSSSFL
ncbi:hypothetical protein J6590_079277 [Homalodisca vitripennis]|nr:hypothetical protein J6590_097899 [Homalodisca vitripennis]KAG8285490.1 hypothetical protein J6590_079273 [Homalodisca vitripennis]KAG8285494.1 hypothetical protein J6590_079277 [Homalodisca vitripennis]